MKQWCSVMLLLFCTHGLAAATLRIEWVTPPGTRTEKLSLVPVDVSLPNGLTRAAAIEAWTQAVSDAPRWRDLPAGTYRLVLRAGSAGTGIVPIELNEVVLSTDEDRLLRLAFPKVQHDARRNDDPSHAAVAIRVRSARTLEPLPKVRVLAVRAHELAARRHTIDFDRLAVATGVTGANGWTRLIGLPEEKLVFVLYAPDRRHPQLTEPYAFDAGAETLVDDLLLDKPANLLVTVDVPDGLREAVELHDVELEPDGHNHWPRDAPIRASIAGASAEILDVPAGTWRVSATGRLKKGFALRLGEQKIEVFPGADQQVSLVMNDMLFHGRVTHRGEPVKGVINLQPAGELRARSAVAYLGDDGTFQVLLESKGKYTANVQQGTKKRGVQLHEPIAFEDPLEEIAIELPEGVIRGRVVDSSGAPVEAVVSAERQLTDRRSGTGAATEADGTFVIDFVSPGTWEVVAETANARSEPEVVAAADGNGSNVTLVVDPVETVTIHVVEASGAPVSNAIVTAEFMRRGDTATTPETRSTNSRGAAQFTLRPWQQMQLVNVYVVAIPDIRLSCALLQLDSDRTMSLPARTGDVRLVRNAWKFNPGTRPWLVSQSGCSVPLVTGRVARDSGSDEAIVIRGLAQGSWSYVATDTPAELWSLATGSASVTPAARFEVRSGGTTRVVVPD